MKKITFFTLHLNYGGIEKCVCNLSNLLCDSYEIEVVSVYKLFNESKFEFNEKIKIKYLINSNLPFILDKYYKLLKKREFSNFFKTIYKDYIVNFRLLSLIKEFVHGLYILKIKKFKVLKTYIKNNDSDTFITTHLFMNKCINKQKKSKFIYWDHNYYNCTKNYSEQFIKSTKSVRKSIVVSEYIKNHYMSKSISSDVVCIPNFINNNDTEPKSDNNKMLISVGRFSNEKGFLDLIDVMKQVVTFDNDIILHLVGDGVMYEEIETKINDLGLNNNIKLYGFLNSEEINQLYKKSSIYVMTSYIESFGLVLLEAMYYKLPCIAFDSAKGAKEIIVNNKSGFLVENRNKEKMTKKIIELLENESMLNKFGEESYEICKKYNPNKIKEKWMDVIDE